MTAAIDFDAGAGVNITGTKQTGMAGGWTLAVVEEPRAVFAAHKTAGQTIKVEGTDALKVTVAKDGETFGNGSVKKIDPVTGADTAIGNPTVYEGFTASETLAVFSVDMEDLLFDANFGGGSHTGTETRAFTLKVSEAEKASRTIPVKLNITLDGETETSIYRRTGTPGAYQYEKVRDAALTTADNKNYFDTSYNFEAYETKPVKDLQNAFVWVDHHGEQGRTYSSGQAAPAGYANGTTEGYSEYRLFLKKNQQIGKIALAYGGIAAANDNRDCISIELYGAGSPGSTEKTIKRDEQKVSSNIIMGKVALNSTTGQNGLISTFNKGKPKYQALILGKNITVSGDGEAVPFGVGSVWDNQVKIKNLIYIYKNSTLIMREHSKVTGYYYITAMSYAMAPIFLDDATSRFYMRGGKITGNTVHAEVGVVAVKSLTTTVDWVYAVSNAKIEGNTPESANRVVNQNRKPIEPLVCE
jgi:hypothetical protein